MNSDQIEACPQTDEAFVASRLEGFRNYLLMAACTIIPRGVRHRLDAEDVVQEALMKARQAVHQFQGTSEPELAAWLRTILGRTIIDRQRQLQSARQGNALGMRSIESVFGVESGRLACLLEASGTSPSEYANRRELGVVLANAMATLPEQYRTVLQLRSLNELDWQDVANEMQKTVGSVRMLWARALIQLRPLIEADWNRP